MATLLNESEVETVPVTETAELTAKPRSQLTFVGLVKAFVILMSLMLAGLFVLSQMPMFMSNGKSSFHRVAESIGSSSK